MGKMYIENRYVKDRRVHAERRLDSAPKGFMGPERRAIEDRRSYTDKRLEPWSWHFDAPSFDIGPTPNSFNRFDKTA